MRWCVITHIKWGGCSITVSKFLCGAGKEKRKGKGKEKEKKMSPHNDNNQPPFNNNNTIIIIIIIIISHILHSKRLQPLTFSFLFFFIFILILPLHSPPPIPQAFSSSSSQISLCEQIRAYSPSPFMPHWRRSSSSSESPLSIHRWIAAVWMWAASFQLLSMILHLCLVDLSGIPLIWGWALQITLISSVLLDLLLFFAFGSLDLWRNVCGVL